MLEQVDWAKPIAIVLFGFLYWEVNHWLHVQAGIGYRPPSKRGREKSANREPQGERPRDRWMGLASLVCLLPVLLVPFQPNAHLVIVVYTAWPTLVVLALGRWRGRASSAAALWFGVHGGGMALLELIDDLAPVRSCISEAATFALAQRVEALAFCVAAARFWAGAWMSVSMAFATVFGASLMILYTIKPQEYGWRVHRKERQVLAVLYCLAAIWILLTWFVWLGLPAIQQLNRAHTLLR